MPSDQLDALDWQQEEEDWFHGEPEEEGAWVVHGAGNKSKAAASSAFQQVNLRAPQQTSSLPGPWPPEAVQCQQQDPHLNVVNGQQQPAQLSHVHHRHHHQQQQQQLQQQQQQPAGNLHVQQLGEQQQQWQQQPQLPHHQQQIQQPRLLTSSAATEQPAQQRQQQVSAVLPSEFQSASAMVLHRHHRPPDELNPSLMRQSCRVASEMEAGSCQSVPAVEGNSRQLAGQALHQLQHQRQQQPQVSHGQTPITAPATRGVRLLPAEGAGKALGRSCTDSNQHNELRAHQSGLGQMQMSEQIAGMKAPSFAEDYHQLGACTQSGNSDAVRDAVLQVDGTELSDFKLAMRLQEQEHAMQRQHSRPVLTGLLRAKQKPRQASGTLHAFFKKA
jgi:hypothetical protein